MNDKHPIDDLFQRGLEQHSVPPPMHIWERIEESRNTRHKSKLILFRQKVSIVSGAAAVLLAGVWLAWPFTPQLGSFPVRTLGAPMASVEQSTLPESLVTNTVQQAGLVPDLDEIIKNLAAEVMNTPDATHSTPVQRSTSEIQVKAPIAVIQGSTAIDDPNVAAAPADLAVVPAMQKTDVTERQSTTPDKLASGRANTLLMDYRKLDVSPVPVPETGCARFSEGRPALFLALTAGPVLPMRQFSGRSEEYVEFANQRSSTESVRLSYGGSARLSMVFPWGGAIRSGVSYTQINEQLVYKNSRVRIITDIYDPNGNVIGTDTTYHEGSTALKYNNRHRLIDIPVQLGYEIRYDKITLAANAGLNVNVAYSQKGNYLSSEDLLPTRFDSDDPSAEPVYKTKVGLGWQASLGLHYQLNDRLDLMAEPYLRYYPQSFTRDDYPLRQKYMVGGVGLGLRVLL